MLGCTQNFKPSVEVPITSEEPLKEISTQVVKTEVEASQNIEDMTKEDNPEPECVMYDNFAATKPSNWQIVNDNVMGGRSLGGYQLADEAMVLEGSINLNGGGFTSVRSALPPNVLKPFKAVLLTV